MILSLAVRDGKRRPRSVALYDIVAALVHATPQRGCGNAGTRWPAGER